MINKEQVKAATQIMRDRRPPTIELSDKQQAIKDAVNGGSWGCQDQSVRALVRAMTGVDCRKSSNKIEFERLALIVFKDELLLISEVDGDHDARFVNKELRSINKHGDCYISCRHEEVRVATDEEIEAFFA